MANAYKILVRKPHGKKSIQVCKHGLDINEMTFIDFGLNDKGL